MERIVVRDEEVEIRYVIPTTPGSEHTHFYQLRRAYCRAVSPQLESGVPTGRPAEHGGRGARGHRLL